MKKIIYVVFAVVFVYACSKDNNLEEDLFNNSNSTQTEQESDESLKRKKKDKKQKVAICHATGSGFQTIQVSSNAAQAHYNHGDLNTDKDGDGYTATFGVENPCNIGDGTDCDDTNAAVNVAAQEIYTDSIDNNCNGVIGSISTTYSNGPCSGCAAGTSGNYKNVRNGKCKDLTSPPTGNAATIWTACTIESISYND